MNGLVHEKNNLSVKLALPKPLLSSNMLILFLILNVKIRDQRAHAFWNAGLVIAVL